MDDAGVKKRKAFFVQASVLKRIGAFLIDLLIINWIILIPFREIFTSIIPEAGSFSKTLDLLSSSAEYNAFITVLMVLIAFLAILYFMILEKKLRQTVGKMIFNLHVEGQNKGLSYWQLFVRSMFLIPVFPFVLLWFIDPVVMLFTKENQRLSEILSRTKVVEKYKI